MWMNKSAGLHLGRHAVAMAALCLVSTSAMAQTPGRMAFDYADGPPAAVEVELSQGMFQDMFGIGDAAIAGVAEALGKSAESKPGAEGTKMAAEQLKAAQEIVQTIGNLVQGVQVRVYKDVKSDSGHVEKMVAHYDRRVTGDGWEPIARARDGSKVVTVAAARKDGAIKGIFVVATDGGNLVLANFVCDISPENVRKITNTATNTGLQAGLGQAIEKAMRKMQQGPRDGKP